MKSNKSFLYFLCISAVLILWNPFLSAGDNAITDVEFKNTIKKTSEYIKSVMNENSIIGLSIALVYDNKVVWADGFGWADKKNKVPAEINTVYMLGSGSKTIATVALLQYMDKGCFKLDDPISSYIQEFQMLPRFNDQSEGLTVRRLLNHHSGIPGDLYNNMGVEQSWKNNLYIDWLVKYLNSDYLSYFPGEIAIYCNTGFILAGEMVKRLSKDKDASFNTIVTKNLLLPLNMKKSSFEMIKEKLAVGYMQGDVVPPIQFNGIAGATGGLFTNVLDMSNFLLMLINQGKLPEGKEILKPETVALMGKSEISPLDINSYFIPGLGLDSVKDSALSYAGRTWIKDGSTGNYNSIMGILPDKKLGVIILTNCDTSHLLKYSIMRVCLKNALSEKFNLEPVKPEYKNMKSESNPEKIIGKYIQVFGVDEIIKSEEREGLLWIRNLPDNKSVPVKLKYNGKRFSVEGASEEVVFNEIDGHFVMIQYGSSGSDTDKYQYDNYVIKLIAEKKTWKDAAKNDTWNELLGKKYVINNIGWNSSGWDDDITLSIIKKDSNFFIRSGNDELLIKPVSASKAFVQGLNNRCDSSVRYSKANNIEVVGFGGYSGADITKLTDITDVKLLKGQKVVFPTTNWYRFSSNIDNAVYHFQIPGIFGEYVLRLFDNSLKLISSDENILNHSLSKGDYYLAVTPMPGVSDSFELKNDYNSPE